MLAETGKRMPRTISHLVEFPHLKKKKIIYLKEREGAWGRGRGRDRERENPKQAPCSVLEPDMGLDLTNCEIVT